MNYNDEKKYRTQGSSAYAYDDGTLRGSRSASYPADDFEKMLYEKEEAPSKVSYAAPTEEEQTRRAQYSYDAPREAPSAYAEPEREFFEAESTPGRTTMQFAEEEQLHANPYEDFRSDYEVESDKRYRINTKGKVLIAVYAIVVAAIFALIILNTRLLKNMNNAISSQQSRLESLKQETEQLREELSSVSDDEEIERKAFEMGMIKN